MPRKINESKYGISHRRYMELVNFCYQYKEWKKWLSANQHTISGQQLDSFASGTGGTSDPTFWLAEKRKRLEENCRLIEECARKAAGICYEHLLRDVTDENVGVSYLKRVMDLPCSDYTYKIIRRKFFKELSDRKR